MLCRIECINQSICTRNIGRRGGYFTHYSKSQIFVPKIQFWLNPQHFHEFFTQYFFDNFSREIKVVNSQKVQNHNIFKSFSPQKIDNFLGKSGKSKLDFWTKNEDFEQCDLPSFSTVAVWTIANSVQQ